MNKFIALLISTVMLVAFTIPTTVFADAASNPDNVNINLLSKKVLSDDFDLQEEVNNIPSVHEMSKKQRVIFNELVNEEVSKFGDENPELYRKTLIDFFDTTSGHANDLAYASQVIENDLLKSESLRPAGPQDVGALGMWDWVPNVKIGVNIAGSIINVALGVAVGGGVGAIQAFIIAKGKKAAQAMFYKTVKDKLTAWGAPKLAVFAGAAVAVAMDYADVGTKIAKYIDGKDKRPNNGWIDIYNK